MSSTPSEKERRVTLVTSELLGIRPAGGIGTANTSLVLALAGLGHRVEVLHYGATGIGELDDVWGGLYERTGITLRAVPARDAALGAWHWDRTTRVAEALSADPPDVVIAQDLGAPAFAALRLRELGLALESTLFVVYCHGTRRWITDASRQVRVTDASELVSASTLERAAVESADVAVSPSAYMLEWMLEQGWRPPANRVVIPLLTRWGATGEPRAVHARPGGDGPVRRLVFFGRLEERKGIGLLLAALDRVDPALLDGLDLELLGSPTPTWSRERVEETLPGRARRALRSVSFEAGLGQPEALARLDRPGTLALIPSVCDNSPNAVYECLELGIPFLASTAGGIPELVAPEDRERVLFDPTVEGMAAALRRALGSPKTPEPANPAFDPERSLAAWNDVVRTRPRARARDGNRAKVDVIVTHRRSPAALERCLRALAGQSGLQARVIVALAGPAVAEPEGLPGSVVVTRSERSSFESARAAGLEAANAPFVCFLDEEDVPDPELLETLVRAQAASGADVVSCGIRVPGPDGERVHLFLGEPGGLGVLGNAYGTVSLVRRSLLEDLETPWPSEHDPDWVLLARLSLAGARLTSVPRALVATTRAPGSCGTCAPDALLVLELAETALPDEVDSVARLAVGLTANGALPAHSVSRPGRRWSIPRRPRLMRRSRGRT